ncbi:peptide-methionine (S)-S-oxide reductase MsrA [Niabella pedocola]|uniref:Peptide methionine sulfoxide reductase MsrA n=1 Tax=Niabella pedocola TaxID=1752077 RepID=A0ABS8PP19_9BACT|nr:peptide-methionine (S)-S-oxide reductase MsrA [Niabella pedocola]MCD2422494.1 peptide-methionine (S)-S-oxide reductase MsrA [Niabella pedocola]
MKMQISSILNKAVFSCMLLLLLTQSSCGQQGVPVQHSKTFQEMTGRKGITPGNKTETVPRDTATFAAGCFWCVEEQFRQLDGVLEVVSGYTGGHTVNPGYRSVSGGTTGHAEACNIIYDPRRISYDALLAAFFVAHDPTTLNRQGNDAGTQYRSAVFYHNEIQRTLAAYYIKRLNEEHVYPGAIVTAVEPFSVFYMAEAAHQDYYANNPEVPYCRMVIKPKRDKFREVFKAQLKQ